MNAINSSARVTIIGGPEKNISKKGKVVSHHANSEICYIRLMGGTKPFPMLLSELKFD